MEKRNATKSDFSLAPDASKNSVQSCFIQEGCGQSICGCAEETASQAISGSSLMIDMDSNIAAHELHNVSLPPHVPREHFNAFVVLCY